MSADDSAMLERRPRLARFARLQHDPTRDRWVLQAPERVFVLDDTGREILERCTGEASVAEIVAALADEYDAPRDMIEHDVLAVVKLMAEKTFLVLEEDGGDG